MFYSEIMRAISLFFALQIFVITAHAQVLSDDDQAKMYLKGRVVGPVWLEECGATFPAKSGALRQAFSAYLAAHGDSIAMGECALGLQVSQKGISLERYAAYFVSKAREQMPTLVERREAFCDEFESVLREDASLTSAQLALREFEQERIVGPIAQDECQALGAEVLGVSKRFIDVMRDIETNGGLPRTNEDKLLFFDVSQLYKSTQWCAEIQIKAAQRSIEMPGRFSEMRQVMTDLNQALASPAHGFDVPLTLQARNSALRFVSSWRSPVNEAR